VKRRLGEWCERAAESVVRKAYIWKGVTIQTGLEAGSRGISIVGAVTRRRLVIDRKR
jgi:hypothetical protein